MTKSEYLEIIEYVANYHEWCETVSRKCKEGHNYYESCKTETMAALAGEELCDGCKMLNKALVLMGKS